MKTTEKTTIELEEHEYVIGPDHPQSSDFVIKKNGKETKSVKAIIVDSRYE